VPPIAIPQLGEDFGNELQDHPITALLHGRRAHLRVR
jgi:hypothetical protein